MPDEGEKGYDLGLTFLKKLKEISPFYYRMSIILIGLASAGALFRAVGFRNYSDLFAFIIVGVVLYSMSVLIAFFMQTEKKRIIFSTTIIAVAACWYIIQVINKQSSEQNRLNPIISCFLKFDSCSRISGKSPEKVNLISNDNETNEPQNKGHRVYVQFAGSVKREKITEFTGKLKALGWVIPRRAERTQGAIGINEIRYYYPEDKEDAIRLARTVHKLPPQFSFVNSLEVRFLGDVYTPKKGLFEIWMSN